MDTDYYSLTEISFLNPLISFVSRQGRREKSLHSILILLLNPFFVSGGKKRKHSKYLFSSNSLYFFSILRYYKLFYIVQSSPQPVP
ncbi:hypothetical protein ES703_81690 [subsurface metagenome]